MPSFESSGVRLHYEVEGDGPPVVLVHGLGSHIRQTWGDWGTIDELAAAGLRVVALDSRGHGRSDKPRDTAAYHGDAFCDDVVALMDHLQIGEAGLAGYSMGGAIAVALLARCPDRIRRAVIAGAGDAVLGPDWGIPRVIMARGRMTSGRGVSTLAAIRLAERPRIDAERLAAAGRPALIIVGSEDHIAARASRLGATLSARVVRVPGNHFTAVAHPHFRRAIVDFLASSNG